MYTGNRSDDPQHLFYALRRYHSGGLCLYGDTSYGVEAAAEDYFGLQPHCASTGCKPAVGSLDLAQASLLAGLPPIIDWFIDGTMPTVQGPKTINTQLVCQDNSHGCQL